MEDWIVKEIADTLRQARVSFLGITALDSSAEIRRKERENETAIVRRIDECLKLIHKPR